MVKGDSQASMSMNLQRQYQILNRLLLVVQVSAISKNRDIHKPRAFS